MINIRNKRELGIYKKGRIYIYILLLLLFLLISIKNTSVTNLTTPKARLTEKEGLRIRKMGSANMKVKVQCTDVMNSVKNRNKI